MQDLYSVTETHPTVNVNNSYETTMSANGTFIDFITTRPLEPTNTTNYIIPLGEQMTMIWAYGAYNASAENRTTTTSGMSYHDTNHSTTW